MASASLIALCSVDATAFDVTPPITKIANTAWPAGGGGGGDGGGGGNGGFGGGFGGSGGYTVEMDMEMLDAFGRPARFISTSKLPSDSAFVSLLISLTCDAVDCNSTANPITTASA